ncbi:MAG: cupin domain-containing protein [Elusimicrobia bacterium]|nr:cupin domain-containing protein [Elusimicrobiota bacterium]
MKKIFTAGLILVCSFASGRASDKAAHDAVHVTALPSTIEWKPGPASLPPGAQVAMLEGDLSKPGYFAVRLKLPAGYKVPAHFHPVQERVTVIEGSFYLGRGEKFDEASLTEYPAGAYISMPKGMRHFAMAKGECIIQLSTIGPWGITYVNPTDDPRNQKSSR